MGIGRLALVDGVPPCTQHGVEAKHLQAYLDEFAFRFNCRRMPMAAFQSLLGLTGVHGSTNRKML